MTNPNTRKVPQEIIDSTSEVEDIQYTWPLEAERKARAGRYFSVHLDNQCAWYNERSSHSKRVTHRLGIVVLVGGTMVTAMQVLPSHLWVQIATALLGGSVVVAKGLEQIWGHENAWRAYRKASEAMKHEYRIYINNTGGYEQEPDEDSAFRAFVDNVEAVIGEESMQFWQRKEERRGPAAAKTAKRTASK